MPNVGLRPKAIAYHGSGARQFLEECLIKSPSLASLGPASPQVQSRLPRIGRFRDRLGAIRTLVAEPLNLFGDALVNRKRSGAQSCKGQTVRLRSLEIGWRNTKPNLVQQTKVP